MNKLTRGLVKSTRFSLSTKHLKKTAKTKRLNEEDDLDMERDTRIFIQGRHLYFHDSINSKTSFDLKQQLLELIRTKTVEDIEQRLDSQLFACQKGSPAHQSHLQSHLPSHLPIYLHIHSPGGVLDCGFDLVDQIKSSPIPVHSIVEGQVASAASLISCVCQKRYIRPNANMLIHQIRGGVSGKCQDVEDGWRNYAMAQKRLVDIYVEHTSMDEKEVSRNLKNEQEYDAFKCLELGLVDEILSPS